MPRTASERTVVFLVGAVQFVNILDFMMVMPLGPDFAHALGIPNSQIGTIGGSYTAAAAVAGLAGSLFLDRFDRRRALAVAMLGLVAGTAMGGFARGLPSLVAARVIAGLFGGPATSLSFSIIADTVPPQRRGKAMGAVMGAFSVASVLGVPAGLELARRGGWRLPFFAVAALGLVIAGLAVALLPPMRKHLDNVSGPPATFVSLVKPLVIASYFMTALTMMAGFILIPNISAYVQENRGYPRDHMWLLYLCGGAVSFAVMRLVGFLVDRWGSFRVGLLGAGMLTTVVYIGFYNYQTWFPMIALFVCFMTAMSFRNVPYNTLTTRVPSPHERARFMSVQSAVQHGASAAGAFLSARLLKELPDHKLEGIPRIAVVTMTLTLVTPLFLWIVERGVIRKSATAAVARPESAA